MSQFVHAPVKSFTAGGALGQYLRVKASSGKMALAGTSDRELGVTEYEVFADLDPIAVRIRTAEGTFKGVASEAITAFAICYAGASGKVASTGTVMVGIALEAATADGDVIEIMRLGQDPQNNDAGTDEAAFVVDQDGTGAKVSIDTNSATGDFLLKIVPPNLSGNGTITLPAATGTLATLAGTETLTNKTITSPVITFGKTLRPVEAHTAGDTLTAAESGSVHTTVGAGATVTLALPAAAVGLEYFFRVGAAQELRIDPDGTETIALPSTGVQGAAGKYLTANADGETVHLMCTKAAQWSVFGFTGTWTAEG